MRVILIHLDLGIGGAERLMVNLACGIKELGHEVVIFTSHHDKSHCFDETKSDGILYPYIRVFGDFLPRTLFGRGIAFFSIIRMIYLSLQVTGMNRRKDDVIIIDGVSAPIPILLLANIPVIFYCHFPDKLLCVERGSWAKKVYRWIIDGVEEITMGCASLILVNSAFTQETFSSSFPSLASICKTQILYPTIEEDNISTKDLTFPLAYTQGFDFVFLSLNRYERKKKVSLAIESVALLPLLLPQLITERNEKKGIKQIGEKEEEEEGREEKEKERNNVKNHDKDKLKKKIQKKREEKDTNDKGLKDAKKINILLVVAGGYDENVRENIEYLQELKDLCRSLSIPFDQPSLFNSPSAPSSSTLCNGGGGEELVNVRVVFRTSIPNEERKLLLQTATALLYTPDNEHFGIVPLESMFAGCPVIAVNSGGPKETIIPWGFQGEDKGEGKGKGKGNGKGVNKEVKSDGRIEITKEGDELRLRKGNTTNTIEENKGKLKKEEDNDDDEGMGLDFPTGFLCSQTPKAFSQSMADLILSPSLCSQLGNAGKKRVEKYFTKNALKKKLSELLRPELCLTIPERAIEYGRLSMNLLFLFLMIFVGVIFMMLRFLPIWLRKQSP